MSLRERADVALILINGQELVNLSIILTDENIVGRMVDGNYLRPSYKCALILFCSLFVQLEIKYK
jgi:hypothetical protein